MTDTQPRIAILGGGPSGLLTAWFLREQGYKQVFVLEKRGEIGGLCRTITVGDRSFDLGANYVVPSYKVVRKLIKRFGVDLYTERPFIAMKLPDDPDGRVTYSSFFDAVRRKEDGTPIPLLRFFGALARYVWIRWRLRKWLDAPTFEDVHRYDEGSLAEPMGTWLADNGLSDLDRVFDLPVTMMGYGSLPETPAIYPLKFMTLKAFIPMVAKEAPFIGRFIPWPKRFTYGYQRFFERLSWDLDVRTSVDVTAIRRHDSGVEIDYCSPDQNLDDEYGEKHTLLVDQIIVACPLRQFLGDESVLSLHEHEHELVERVDQVSYCMTTRDANFDESGSIASNSPLAAVFPVPEEDLEAPVPYGVAKQWKDQPFAQFYTRTPWPDDRPIEEIQAAVERGVNRISSQMGAMLAMTSTDLSSTFNRWLYFQHLKAPAIKSGWYEKLERLQGERRTYWVGGPTSFELVESIAEYTQHLVAKHFPRVGPAPARKRNWWRWLVPIGLALLLGYCGLSEPPKALSVAYPLGEGTARPVTEDFWRVFQAGELSQIAVEDCSLEPASGTNPGAREDILCRLTTAMETHADDVQLPNILAATHLWRVQTKVRPENFDDEFEFAARYAGKAVENGNRLAGGFRAAALWLHGYNTENADLKQQGYDALVTDALDYPAFHGFIEGANLATMLDPREPDPSYEYRWATISLMENIEACLFGDYLRHGYEVLTGLRMNRFIFNASAGLATVTGRQSNCYNNTVAPFNMQGMYLAQGDAYLKGGDHDLARIAYQNALVSPNIESWAYSDRVRYRLEHMEETRQKFLADTGSVNVDPEPVAMLAQSRYYCASCHQHGPD